MQTLMVANGPLSYSDQQFRKLFSAFGRVERVILSGALGKCEGCAFVDMADAQEAAAARQALHGHQVGGQVLTVESFYPSFG